MSTYDYVDLDQAEQPHSAPRSKPEPLAFVNASSWQGAAIPIRRWLVPKRIPMKNVTLIQGDGGMGKTTIALQLAVSVDQGTDWLGSLVDEPGPAIFLSAEEDDEEMHRRIAAIVEHRGIAFRDLKAVHLLGMPGEDVTLGAPARYSDTIHPTPFFDRLKEAVDDIRPKGD
jgi:RecA-family ATPase